jgi:hypothetical protein
VMSSSARGLSGVGGSRSPLSQLTSAGRPKNWRGPFSAFLSRTAPVLGLCR